MTTQEKSVLNRLRRDLALSQSSVKLLRIDNDRKTRELDRLRGLIRAVARTCEP